jgi:hypothetical protein
LRKKCFALIVLIIIATIAATSLAIPLPASEKSSKLDQCYVGVAFGGNTTTEAKMLIDKVKTYSNLFILQSGPVSWNETATNEICDYAVAADLNIVVYFGDFDPHILAKNGTTWRINWVNSTRLKWGNHFLGVYFYDEPGGIWLDTDWNKLPLDKFLASRHLNVTSLTYDAVATAYVSNMKNWINFVPSKASVPVFVSDYALHWFDYLGGYDVVLAQIGWNNSLSQEIALVRGAAQMQNKTWGAMITWKYNQPPYLDNGKAIHDQMTAAYEAGAKYIGIFNYPSLDGNQYGVMLEEHFEALKQFWNEATTNKIIHGSQMAQAALVLPKNYGWGMRNPQDRIWGFWGPDEKSPQIWELSRKLLTKYGLALDIIYDDADFSFAEKYSQVYYYYSDVS